MAEATNGGANPEAPAGPQFKMQVMAQYIRDLSFENIVAQKGINAEQQHEAQLQVGVNVNKRGTENHYEVVTKYTLNVKNKGDGNTLFLLELEHAGLFLVEGLPDEQLHAFLNIECPRITYPFARRIISDTTRDGAVQEINLEMIDFVSLFRQRLKQQQQNAAAQAPGGNDEGGEPVPS